MKRRKGRKKKRSRKKGKTRPWRQVPRLTNFLWNWPIKAKLGWPWRWGSS